MVVERIEGIAIEGQCTCCKKNCKNFLIGDLHKANVIASILELIEFSDYK